MLLLLPVRGFTLTHLFGKRFVVESDHKPLDHEMIHLKNLTAAPLRMLLRIQGYDLTVKYKPSAEMLLAH